jgi:hypothetical protein
MANPVTDQAAPAIWSCRPSKVTQETVVLPAKELAQLTTDR